jgi:hypothetical protein
MIYELVILVYVGGGDAGFFHLSLTQLLANRRLPGRQPNQSEWKRPIIFPTFFYLFKVFLQKYTLYKETPEEKKIAKMIIEEYI